MSLGEAHMDLLWKFKNEALEERSVEEYVSELQKANFPVNAKTTTLMQGSPVAFAAGYSLPNVVKALVQLGADPNQPDKSGSTALGDAVCGRGYPKDTLDTVKFLLSLPGINVNHLHDGKAKMTALHIVIESAKENIRDELLDMLLEHPDIDVLIKNGKGDTPLDTAVAEGDKYAVTQLEAAEEKQRAKAGSSTSGNSSGSAWTGESNNELKTLVLLLAETVANLPHVDEKISGRIRQIAHKLK